MTLDEMFNLSATLWVQEPEAPGAVSRSLWTSELLCVSEDEPVLPAAQARLSCLFRSALRLSGCR